MSLAKFNKSSNVNWDIDTKGWDFKKAIDIADGKAYPLKGIFFTPDNGYGTGTVIISDGFLVNCPSGFEAQAKEICNDAEAVAAIKAGNETFTVNTYTSKKYKKLCADIKLN